MTSKFIFFKYGFAFFALSAFFLPVSLEAQDSEFQTANRMIQQQNYEEAVVILQRLHEENPDANIFLDRLLDGLVYLEDYEDAVRYIDRQIQRGDNTDHLLIRKAEIVHMKGDREAATDLLRSVVEKNQNNMQIYFQAGNALLNRREYRLAAELYLEARSNFGDSTLFINEIANAHMQSGNFEEAVSEYFRLVRENPGQINFVQQRLMRMQDKDLFETAAMEFEDHLTDLDTSHEAYHELHQLYTWLLIETGQFQRAFSAARQYESRTESTRYSLYSLAEPLAENNEYKLAADAYRYYSESADRVLRYRSIDNQSRIYRLWADYLENHNLDDLQKREELYRKSYQTAAGLLNEAPEYEQRGRVMVRLAEISLDIFYDSEKANRWIDLLTEQNNGEPHANLLYLQGRLHLFNRSYSEARQAFTRANREAGEALPAEKSRYFLSLTDFFSGDFEFALLQLGELERRNGSYFANDGLKLRMWIQKGTRADTSGNLLRDYARVIEELYSGSIREAVKAARPVLENPGNSLSANTLVQISSRSGIRHASVLYPLIDHFNRETEHSPLRERLLWEQAAMAKIIVDAGGHQRLSGIFSDENTLMENPGGDSILNSAQLDNTDWPVSVADVEELYEKIILEFPRGFYAPYARKQLQDLTQPSS